MNVVFADEQSLHYPQLIQSSGAFQANPEAPERAERLLAAALGSGLTHERPPDYGLDPIAGVHTPEYLHFLQNIHTRWKHIEDASEDVVPNIHPDRRDVGYPASAVGQVGYHVFDGAAPITADTWESARWSANSAVHAALDIIGGSDASYALARPPGHHATRDQAGGFCYLNNSAIAANVLRSHYPRVAVLDVDVHHGNGTQNIFYDRSDVLTVSLHTDPVRFYPFFWGYANERGERAGLGSNLNLPLPRGTSNDEYLRVLEGAITRIEAFAPGALVVALGLDAHEADPFDGMAITTDGFGRIADRISRLDLPTVMVQEGGYLTDHLGNNLSSFLDGFSN